MADAELIRRQLHATQQEEQRQQKQDKQKKQQQPQEQQQQQQQGQEAAAQAPSSSQQQQQPKEAPRWSVLGQSFGGFCAVGNGLCVSLSLPALSLLTSGCNELSYRVAWFSKHALEKCITLLASSSLHTQQQLRAGLLACSSGAILSLLSAARGRAG